MVDHRKNDLPFTPFWSSYNLKNIEKKQFLLQDYMIAQNPLASNNLMENASNFFVSGVFNLPEKFEKS